LTGRAGTKLPGGRAPSEKAMHWSGQRSAVRRARLFNPDQHDALFSKAEFLIQRQNQH
jgi:hypothetical protein